jgi:hypothetical protein
MQSRNEKDPADRFGAGVKTALFVCVIGFVALMANRSLVAPGGASPVEAPAAPAMIAPDTRTPTLVPSDQPALATLPSLASDGAAVQEVAGDGDNHPPSF